MTLYYAQQSYGKGPNFSLFSLSNKMAMWGAKLRDTKSNLILNSKTAFFLNTRSRTIQKILDKFEFFEGLKRKKLWIRSATVEKLNFFFFSTCSISYSRFQEIYLIQILRFWLEILRIEPRPERH